MTSRSEPHYLVRIRAFVFLMAGLFLISVGSGVALGRFLPFDSLEFVRRAFGGLLQLSPIALVLVIFLNNALKSLVALLLGVLFGIAPVIFVSANGFLIGVLSEQMSREKGAAFTFAALAPHGLLELPAVLISSAIGMKLGYELIRSLRGRGSVGREIRRGLAFFVRWLLPLFLIAAAVEVFVTPLLVRSVVRA